MVRKIRPAIVAFGAAALIATAITGLTSLRGETREANIDAACAAAEWPKIPSRCLEGGHGDVRTIDLQGIKDVGTQGGSEQLAMAARFETAFQ